MNPAANAPVIGHVVLSLDVGGLERMVASLAAAQRAAGSRVFVYCLDRGGELAGPLPGGGVTVRMVGRRGRGFDPGAVRRLWRMLHADRATVVHCHNYGALVYGALAARVARGTRVVYTIHGAVTSGRRATAWFQNLGLVREVVFVSEHARRIGQRAGALRHGHVHTVVNGVDVTVFGAPGDARAARGALGLAADAPVCGMVARLTPAKDHRTLFEAIAIARRSHPRIQCLVVGDGELRAELEAFVAARELGANIHFAGAQENVTRCLAAMDVFVLSSVTEGLAMTLLEAMAASRPVVATRVGGNSEVVVDGETGLLVPPGDPDALAAGLMRLLDAPATASAMGRAGYERARNRFSLEAMRASYDGVYAAALEPRR